MKKQIFKSMIISAIIASALIIISLGLASAAEASYCCEKTLNGAWCQNDAQANCDPAFKSAPTACDSTSYCKRGCCFDSHEGLCMENTAQRVCEDAKGTWADDEKCDIIQCQLGCCVLADQGAFVTLTRCKQLSGFYGLETDFRKNINDELTCIATAGGEEKGACVKTDPATGGKTCKFTTRSECKEGYAEIIVNVTNETTGEAKAAEAGTGFYADILCSAEELGTECGPSQKTILLEGKDEVYFQDTCGNQANIYDAERYDDREYWKKVFRKSESCNYGSSNAGSTSCGNCDYFLGSIGRKATGILGRPAYGDYICIDLSCKSQGKRHGESWCVSDSPSGDGKDTAGSRHFKEVCLNGDVLTEPCADYRGEICIEGTFNGFSEAACRANRWQDCLQQEEKADCENTGIRDCLWKTGYYYSEKTLQIEKSIGDEEAKKLEIEQTPEGVCLPNYPPGLNFWGASDATSSSSTTGAGTGNFSSKTPAFGTGYVNPTKTAGGTSASGACAVGNAKIAFKWEKVTRLWPRNDEAWECANDACKKFDKDPANANITSSEAKTWAKEMNEFCYRLGDCGGYINWLGAYTEEGYAAYLGQKRVAGSGGAKIKEAEKTANSSATTTTGSVVLDLIKNMFGGAE